MYFTAMQPYSFLNNLGIVISNVFFTYKARRKAAQEHKEEGNSEFKSGNYESAIDKFTAAIVACPMCYAKDRSIMYSNRGACKYRMVRVYTIV